MPSLGLGLGTQFVRPLLDSDVAAFKTESGATDVAALNRLVRYLKAQSLYDNFVIYPMKSAQNAGSGATVYSLGGLTTNDATLINSPTWGANGIAFNGTNQYYTIPDFLSSALIFTFTRMNTWTLAANRILSAQYESSGDNRSFALNSTASVEQISRSESGSVIGVYAADSAAGSYAVDRTYVCSYPSGSDPLLWRDKTSQSVSLIFGTSQTSNYDTSVPLSGMSDSDGGLVATGTKTAQAYCTASLTATQREAITDLINAL